MAFLGRQVAEVRRLAGELPAAVDQTYARLASLGPQRRRGPHPRRDLAEFVVREVRAKIENLDRVAQQLNEIVSRAK